MEMAKSRRKKSTTYHSPAEFRRKMFPHESGRGSHTGTNGAVRNKSASALACEVLRDLSRERSDSDRPDAIGSND